MDNYQYRNGEVWTGPTEFDLQLTRIRRVAASLPKTPVAVAASSPTPRRASSKTRFAEIARRRRERSEATATAMDNEITRLRAEIEHLKGYVS